MGRVGGHVPAPGLGGTSLCPLSAAPAPCSALPSSFAWARLVLAWGGGASSPPPDGGMNGCHTCPHRVPIPFAAQDTVVLILPWEAGV